MLNHCKGIKDFRFCLTSLASYSFSLNARANAIISPSGEILQPTPWWEPAVIKSHIPLRRDITFFVRHGDITGRVCTFLFLLLLLALGVRFVTRN